jgi:hypothetical protein
MAYASTVGAAITALLAAFSAAPGLSGVEVRDGPQAPDTSAIEAVYVGWTGDETHASDAWTSQETPEGGLGGQPHRESYSVHCSAMVLNPDEDLPAARARALALRAAAAAAVAADQTLGKTVLRATPGAGAGRQVPVANGIKVYVLFDVDCDAFTVR